LSPVKRGPKLTPPNPLAGTPPLGAALLTFGLDGMLRS
jgi:hypothetical protein